MTPGDASKTALQWAQLVGVRRNGPTHVVARSLTHETVLLDLRSGLYYGLRGTAAAFYDVLTGPDDLEEACERLAATYGQSVERIQEDLLAFATQLADRELLELH